MTPITKAQREFKDTIVRERALGHITVELNRQATFVMAAFENYQSCRYNSEKDRAKENLNRQLAKFETMWSSQRRG